MRRARVILSRCIAAVPLEALIWAGALVYLGFHDPTAEAQFTFCPLKNLGFDFCPGCGLGRSISYFLHGYPSLSFQIHPLGIPATFILAARSAALIIRRPPVIVRHSQLL